LIGGVLLIVIAALTAACGNNNKPSAHSPDKRKHAARALSKSRSFAFHATQRINDSNNLDREFKEVLRMAAIAIDPFIQGIDSGVTSETVRRLEAAKTESEWRFALEDAVRINEKNEKKYDEAKFNELGQVLGKHAINGGYSSGDIDDLAPLINAFKACERFSVITKELDHPSERAERLALANKEILGLLSEITSAYMDYRLWCDEAYDKQTGLARTLLDNGNLWNPDFSSTFTSLDELAKELIARDRQLSKLKPEIQRVQLEVQRLVTETDGP
jgi:hypothetical protein